ncbi:phosphate ABC transporter substrate-binding protein PstS [Actinotalea sp. M2MS4P-6]|uniref:phosphate ABC transporter substrate-binding protein PstS n=1 Tax=Actinotalea sp. M2MS4P-6 TaxID=2983762 RepID=UPI0021E372C4|nr:phosphate ABC transporter substrate-binding protein PstS [Actinotalea sp. M2MS4P-6]MCV2395045.1 phosphate ABC transporter substrate-binding protein PstS [Actinotalea sp. M2MS4P-6]
MTPIRNRRLAATAVMGALALTLAACGSDNPTGATSSSSSSSASADDSASTLSGEIVGAGASTQESAMNAWIAEFQNANSGVTISYDPVGSGGGRTQFIDGGTDWAGSDAYLTDEEVTAAEATCGGEIMELPIYISPIAIIYNLPSVSTQINMSAETIAKVFNGDITMWNDPAIAADNEGVDLPDTAITVVHRSDESGTTKNFTDYLSKAAGSAWPYEASGDWPVEGQQSAQGTSGVVQTVQGAEGTIGYADASQAGSLGTVAVGVGDEFVPYSAEAAAAVVDSSTPVSGRSEFDFAIDLKRDTTESGNYPVVLVSYVIGCVNYPADQVDLMKAWFGYIVSAEGQDVAAGAAGSAPISDTLRNEAMSAIDAISAS